MARRRAPEQSYVPSYYFVLVLKRVSETMTFAFEWLERAYQERSTVLACLQLDPATRALAL